MKDLFDTITSNERKMQRDKSARRKTRDEFMLESEALYDAMGGDYSDRSFFDLDHAMAATGRRSSGRGESIEDAVDLSDALATSEEW